VQMQKRCIALDVNIMDPHHEEENEQIQDVLDIGQSILLEVWDSDALGFSAIKDFLGEAWLPPLSTFNTNGQKKDVVLPLHKADFSGEGENGASREDKSKHLEDDKIQITGEIFVSVQWKFPLYDPNALQGLMQSVQEWIREPHIRIQDHAIKSGKMKGKTFCQAVIETYGPEAPLRAIHEQEVNDDGSMNRRFFSGPVGSCLDSSEKKRVEEFFKNMPKGDIAGRADIQDKMHKGELTLTIKRAQNLRRADTISRVGGMGTCDPKVQVYIRNDNANRWRKKPLDYTKVGTKEKNKLEWAWDHTMKKEIFTGAYEAKIIQDDPTLWGDVQRNLLKLNRRAYRRYEEDKAISRVRRFGQEGLKVIFKDESATPQSHKPGDNHGVEVMIGDTIREFKQKLMLACEKEANHWSRTSEQAEQDENCVKYSDIFIGFRHLVMAFVPTPKLQKMFAQKMHEGEAYKHAYKQAMDDPSNWEPLDPTQSFQQYQMKYAFGPKRPTMLRVVEATEAYKAQNLRYKYFEESFNVLKRFEDTNEKTKCFGWAKYRHENDLRDEWRPAFVTKEGHGDGTQFKVRWIFPSIVDPMVTDPKRREELQVKAQSTIAPPADVLIGPRFPRFDDETIKEHIEYLKQALPLRKAGKSDWEIEVVLTQLMDEDRQRKKEEGGVDNADQAMTPITLDEIRQYLQREEELQANSKKAAFTTDWEKRGEK